MITLEGGSADEVWQAAVDEIAVNGLVQPSRDQTTRELLHVAFAISDPRQRVVFGRPFNPALAVAETIWILSGGNTVDFVRFWNPRMAQYLDDGSQCLHGAYGSRLGSTPRLGSGAERRLRLESLPRKGRLDQLRQAFEVLRDDPHSRQVVLQIWDADLDLPDPVPQSRDVPCNLMSHLLVRDGRLEWLQMMRSNDLFWGTPVNFIQFTSLQEIMAGWLGLECGTYTHISSSLHVYQRHWDELNEVAGRPNVVTPRNETSLQIRGYAAWEEVWGLVADLAVALTERRDAVDVDLALARAQALPVGYRQWIALLAAESLRRAGALDAALDVVQESGVFWSTSWMSWFRRMHPAHDLDETAVLQKTA
jgi:thymidylate synthase